MEDLSAKNCYEGIGFPCLVVPLVAIRLRRTMGSRPLCIYVSLFPPMEVLEDRLAVSAVPRYNGRPVSVLRTTRSLLLKHKTPELREINKKNVMAVPGFEPGSS